MKRLISHPNFKWWLIAIVGFINILALHRFGFNKMIDYYWHLMISTFAGAVWGFLMFHVQKNVSDNTNGQFDYVNYQEKHWDDWVITFLVSFFLVGYLPEAFPVLDKYLGLMHPDLYYLMPGPIVLILVYGVSFLIDKFKPKQ